ncbi:MAG TPA: SlyX family protein [Candidatus Limnocylindria bacterium]|jgi:uncharacterized coiled-coil protein SlyX|nr:SlyX family protein [Candidatus Limnocylindria bacterium]
MNDEKERLARLEELVAHLQHDYDQLNKVAIEQGRLLTKLQRKLEETTETVQRQEMERVRETSSKPPHYSV